MKKDIILKRDDGKQIKITVSFTCSHSSNITYDIEVNVRQPPKRKWTPVYDGNSHHYRALSFPEGRRDYVNKKQLELITPEEILDAKLSLWEELKPNENNKTEI